MAPTLSVSALEKRQSQYCGSGWYWDSYNNNCYQRGTWNYWGRWVALVLIILFFLFIGFLFVCVQSRRRRRAGLAPAYGTGWLAGNKPNTYQSNGYYANQGQYGAPAPPYSPPQQQQQQQYTGNTFNQNDGYYGQQSGIELQQPQHAYQPTRAGGEDVYAPPEGPPPGKGDGIVR